MYRSILVPVDGSPHSRCALEVAACLVDREGSLYVLNVQEAPVAEDTLGRLSGAPARDAEEIVQSSGRAVIDDVREDFEPDTEHVSYIVRSGRPADVILSEAERLGVSAIVVGSRGMADMASLMLGSVSHRVLHEAQCSVVIVR